MCLTWRGVYGNNTTADNAEVQIASANRLLGLLLVSSTRFALVFLSLVWIYHG
jgi:hypothetical protein